MGEAYLFLMLHEVGYLDLAGRFCDEGGDCVGVESVLRTLLIDYSTGGRDVGNK